MASIYTPGTGTIKSTNIPSALLEMVQIAQTSELAFNVANPDTPVNNVTVTYDSEAGTATVTATLPIAVSLGVDGRPIIDAVDYL